MIMGQNNMANRFIGDAAHTVDDLIGQPRGGLRLDDHHTVIADDHARIRISLSGKGIKPLAHFGETDLLFRQIAR